MSCPTKCICHVNSSQSDASPLWTSVDCSNASLESLPDQLPENTRKLDVSHNEVLIGSPSDYYAGQAN